VWQGDTLHQVRAARHVFATGAIEQPLVFAGNDLPGVMLSGGARRLAALYAVLPGRRAVVATTSDRGLHAALALRDAGVDVVAVADYRAERSPAGARLQEFGVSVLNGARVLAAKGRKVLSAALLEDRDGQQRELPCDLLVCCGGEAPATALVTQAGGRTAYDPQRGHFALAELPPTVLGAGQMAGAEQAEVSGELAGLEAAHALGFGSEGSRARSDQLGELLGAGAGAGTLPASVTEVERPAPGKAFACLCEDVTAKDIARAVREGYDSSELCKRFTTVTMGPCQGRMCQLAAIRQLAAATGLEPQQLGATSARPPWSSVPLGALAGRPIEPAKRSSIHGRHRELGARVEWAGDWRRPYDYGDPEGEALNVHERAGLIDVSTLGKLIVRGPDAGEFLDRLYPNRLSNLKPGRVRYGVLATDAGRIMDDGTITRLDEDTFYVTTTSSGAGAVEQWFSWWLADWGLDVRLSDVTQGLAAVNLAGPRAREILTRLTDLDCSPEAFAYLDAREAPVAGVGAMLMRIGFVGELGYEIHFPACFGEDVWEAIMTAGESDGIRPFGLEPQRVLRLQKQHIIVGQDTDSESTPISAGMPWAVKLDKEQDFIGKWALERAAASPAETTLVGFAMQKGDVPSEGAVVLDAAGSAAGQVTSARRSRQLARVIGMAWVPRELAIAGAQITIADRGARLGAEVVTEPFHDPGGELLRS
jgi:sarcosine oxidase subunit alpha